MERWHAKLICLVGIFILPLVCTLVPYKVHDYFTRRGPRGKKILSCLMCFGGGVFFATFILHMGPEVRAILDEAFIKPNHITYPVADTLMGAGFFIVFFLEKVILKCYKRRQQQRQARRQEQCYQFNKVSDGQSWNGAGQRVGNGELSARDAGNIVQVVPNGVSKAGAAQGGVAVTGGGACPLRGTGDCCNDAPDIQVQMADSDETTLAAGEPVTAVTDQDSAHAHATRSLVLVVALSLHRIFEGMSLGLQHTTQNVWNLFIAVLCHETVIGFGLGLQFVKNKFTFRRMLLATFLCSIIMPIGVAIGTVLVEVGGQSNGLNLINGILQAISTGTFIYVTFFEILQEEIDPHDTSLSKFFSVFLGFVVMALLSLIPEETTVGPPHANLTATVTTLAP